MCYCKRLNRACSLTGFVFCIQLLATVSADELSDGVKAYWRKDYITAVKLLEPQAERGVPKAQYFLGLLSDRGNGVPKDPKKAAEWYLKAAEQGYVAAQHNIAYMHLRGEGVAQDYAEAMKWYRKAAEQGSARSQYDLGLMYDLGQGVAQDYVAAVQWYHRSAKQGYVDAQFNLANMYRNGYGVKMDLVVAYALYRLAGSTGNKQALEQRDAIAKKLSPEQLKKGELLSDRWHPGAEPPYTSDPQ